MYVDLVENLERFHSGLKLIKMYVKHCIIYIKYINASKGITKLRAFSW